MRSVWGVAVMVAVAQIGLVLWGGPVISLWERTFAAPCPAEAAAPDCLVTVPGRVDYRFDDYAEGDVSIALEIPGAPVATDYGNAHAVFTREAADRIGIRWDSHDVPVTVTLFGNGVEAITGPTGVTRESRGGVTESVLRLLAASAGAILLVAAGGLLWRRIRGGGGSWIRRAAVCTMIGALVGAAFANLGNAWIMPVAFVAMAVVGVGAAFVRLPRVWTQAATSASGP